MIAVRPICASSPPCEVFQAEPRRVIVEAARLGQADSAPPPSPPPPPAGRLPPPPPLRLHRHPPARRQAVAGCSTRHRREGPAEQVRHAIAPCPSCGGAMVVLGVLARPGGPCRTSF